MRVILFAGSWLGAKMVHWLSEEGHHICVVSPRTEDRAAQAARLAGCELVVKNDAVPLTGHDIPWRPDMIICAHAFRIVPDWVLHRCKGVSIGYHPSLLPAYKGRRAIQDCLDSGARITGGSVYYLGPEIDGGSIVQVSGKRLQKCIQIIPGETASQLWQRALGPLGLELLKLAVNDFIKGR